MSNVQSGVQEGGRAEKGEGVKGEGKRRGRRTVIIIKIDRQRAKSHRSIK
jgi:hypothetical protein